MAREFLETCFRNVNKVRYLLFETTVGARSDFQVPTMADFQNEKWERLEKKKKKGVLKNKKKTFVMIYCFARAQPKPTKREEKEEENTTTNARQ